MGFIAQEAKDVILEVVEKKGEYYSMQYAPVTALLIEAVKIQDKRIEQLEKENKRLQNLLSENNDLRSEIDSIKTALNKLLSEQD